MANVNKVIYGGRTLIDLSGDTKTFSKDGKSIETTATYNE